MSATQNEKAAQFSHAFGVSMQSLEVR
jgi:hypothetical protein